MIRRVFGPRFITSAILLLLAAGCRGASQTPDQSSQPDLLTLDLQPSSDLTGPPDLTVPADLTGPPDLTAPADLIEAPDLTAPADLTEAPDLTAPADLTEPSDLTPPVDLTVPPDLAPQTCTSASQCPGADTACQTRTCINQICGVAYTGDGTPLAQQQPGDCATVVCNGSGGTRSIANDTDLPADNNQCTDDVCTAGVPTNPAMVLGTQCTQGGGSICNGLGACIEVTSWVMGVGDGFSTLAAGTAAPIFIDRYRLNGTRLGRINLPDSTSGNQQACTSSGGSFSEGGLSRSADGRYVTLAGYAATPGTTDITLTGGPVRVIARIDASQRIDTSTVLSNAFLGSNVRAATSADGTGFWVSGSASGSSGGTHYVAFGSTGTSTQILVTPNNMRFVHIYGGQLYGSSGASDSVTGAYYNLFTIGTGLPKVGGQTVATLPGLTTTSVSPYSFALLDRDPAIAGVDTLYIADDALVQNIGVQKWTFDGSTWTRSLTFNTIVGTNGNVGARGLTAVAVGSGVVLIATTSEPQNRLVYYYDTDNFPNSGRSIATSIPNTAYRGVALPPI